MTVNYVILETSRSDEQDKFAWCECEVVAEKEETFIIAAWEKDAEVNKKDCVSYPILIKETGIRELDKHLGNRIQVYFDKYTCYTTSGSTQGKLIEVQRENLEFSQEYD